MNPFIEPLPETIEAKLRAINTHDEDVVIQVASDLNAEGAFEAQWLVATEKRLFLIPFLGENGAVEVPFEDVKDIQVEERVGAGCLMLAREMKAPISIPYSNSLAAKFAEVAGGIRQLSNSKDLILPEKVTQTRCDRCGRLLPEQDGICPACIRKWDTLRRIAGFLTPYRFQVILLMGLAVFAPLVALIPPQIVRSIIDDALTAETNMRLLTGRTTFAIAHRLSTLHRADRLVVLDGGKVAEVGTHQELMAREGILHGLVKTQQETSGVVAVGGGKDDPNKSS